MNVVLFALLGLALAVSFVVCLLKGKYRMALIGLLAFGIVLWPIGALFPAKLGSWWWRKMSLRNQDRHTHERDREWREKEGRS